MTEGDTTFSTLVHQFHKSLVNHYTKGGKHLYGPDEMEKFYDEHSPGLFEDIFYSIYNDEKDSPSTKRTNLQRIRVVAVLHNLSFFRNQVWLLFPKNKNKDNTITKEVNNVQAPGERHLALLNF